MLSARFSMCATSAGLATTQPVRQPVMAWDLDRLPMLTVRSRMPSRVAKYWCGCSKVRLS
ncbi:hypothetical protein D3C84_1255550 [compost metagenome]